ncbi:MAG: acyl-CoA carboxylase subunit beta [Gammaproteobacteria bacterium]|nr:acyl-CoA carboxylase subunit beta [Gammaproteobacteria bacterium]
MTVSKELLRDLRERRKVVSEGGGKDKAAARHKKGQLTARERIDYLFQEGTFQEIGRLITHRARGFGMSDKVIPADGIVVGTGYLDGRQVATFSQDFTVSAGTLGEMHAEKMVKVMEYALKMGIPLIAFKDSGGARIQEGVDALSGYGRVFYHNVLLSGVVPQIAIIAGPCAGGAAYSPALMDFTIMTRENAYMFITGPQVIKAVTGRNVSMDQVGSSAVHATVSGNAHFVAENDQQAIELARRLLSYLPSNNTEDPPHQPTEDMDLSEDPEMEQLVPDDAADPMDVRRIIERLVDTGDFFEVHAAWAQNILVGFARVEGVVIGLIANNPTVKAGALDIDASDKAAKFIRVCNVFNVPLVTLVDVPGFLPGIDQERGGIIRHGAKMLFAYASATVPKITIILRKAYGGSYLAMCSQEMGADFVYAWPTAQIAVMGAEGAVNILYSKEIKEADDPKALAAQLTEQYKKEVASPYLAASKGYITDVIEPAETRSALALALRKTLSKRELRPPKKHGDIPL